MKNKIQKTLSLPALLLGLASAQLHAAINITPTLLPDLASITASSIVLRQDIDEKNVGTRYRAVDGGDNRSILQSFQWNNDRALVGIAFKLSSQTLAASQNFELRVFEIAGVTNGSAVNSKLETYTFTLGTSSLVGGNYLYFALPNGGLPIVKNKYYDIQITATSVVGSNDGTHSLSFRASNGDTLSPGSGSQVSWITDPTSVNSVGWDFTFALVAAPIPEPATAGLTLAGGALLLVALLRRHRFSMRTRDRS
ncbi:PEP-CTERM putative exosortase interaction domain-containing protein [Opitutaceae bacterium TAV1]|nr:PEP-CTERM putative exosortase interaction domain-containing protein [Opitutaceae bacterium TAV1]